jgi:hypothetical protein
MSISNYFASTYAEAREKFRTTAKQSGADLHSYELNEFSGPNNEALTTDVALIGPNDAENVLFIISGTHGVEGFAGSGCQVGFFIDELYEAFPSNTLCVLIHALNPYGFAWLRRVNESNVDINRNFQDFTQALPSAEAYEEIHDLLIPAD